MSAETADSSGPPAATGAPDGFPIVGIGASAGGLEALRGFFKRITCDSMAFVVVQHLAPDRESILAELIARETTMPVLTIQDDMPVASNHVYVAPPGHEVAILHGVLHLLKPPASVAVRLPIDFFFRALAKDRGSLAVGVVLSGTGSDGANGIQAIKADGGITFVQDPTSARFDGMPRAALETGAADFSLPVEQIADELMGISQHPYLHPRTQLATPDGLRKIFILLRAAFGHDFSLYKHATIARRTERRMALHKIERLDDYVTYLQGDPAELAQLSRDLLISVTSFFRDPDSFDVLKADVLTAIAARRTPSETIRVWSAGCATGEEPYSVAMCLFELLDGRSVAFKFQIFATDIDEEAVRRARRGIYPQSIELDVTPERLHRFFVKRDDGGYQVQRHVRDAVVFATQNVTRDPPFSRVDLICCRNLLIYLQQPLQKKVMAIFHYALRPDGCLFLGNSESVGDSPDLFSLVDRKHKIYGRKNIPATAAFDIRLHDEAAGAGGEHSERNSGKGLPMVSVQQLADRKVLERYGPPGVVINENLDVIQYRGHTGRYLEPAPGQPTQNILKLARPEIMVVLRPAIQEAFEKNQAVEVASVRLRSSGETRTIRIELLPIQEPESRSRCLIILFRDDALEASPSEPTVPKTGEERDTFIADLERELMTTKEYLQSTIEELETSNEELKSTVEELQSSNEELQSTNEELETSKEELQSTNEELTTVNDELQNRMNAFRQSNEDVVALEAGLDTALVMVTADLRIRRFTLGASRVFKLVPEDVGRPAGFLKSSLGPGELERLISTVMARLIAHEETVQIENRWFRLLIVPNRSTDRTVSGAILTFTETDPAQGTELSKRLAHQIEDALSGIQRPVVVLDERSAAVWANQAFYSTFKVDAAGTIGNLIQNLGNGQWAHPKLRALIQQVLDGGPAFQNFRIEHEFEGIGKGVVHVSGARIPDTGDARLVVVELDHLTPADKA